MAQNNAGIKWTALPQATLPLSGAEIVCLVQGGISKQSPASAVGGGAPVVGYAAFAVAAGASNNVVIPGFDLNTKIVDISTPAGNAQVTGFVAGTNGQRIVVTNLGPNQLRFDALTGSAAANQFRAASNLVTLANMTTEFMYSTDVSKWLVIL